MLASMQDYDSVIFTLDELPRLTHFTLYFVLL